MIKCPHCGSSNFCKNGHSHNGSQQYICKSCHKTFRPSSFNKPKLFSFIYPRCPVRGKSMKIYKNPSWLCQIPLFFSSALMNLSYFSKIESITSGSLSIGKLRRLLLGISLDIVIILMLSSCSNKLNNILTLSLLMDFLCTNKLLKNCSVQVYIREFVLVKTMLLNQGIHFSKISYA